MSLFFPPLTYIISPAAFVYWGLGERQDTNPRNAGHTWNHPGKTEQPELQFGECVSSPNGTALFEGWIIAILINLIQIPSISLNNPQYLPLKIVTSKTSFGYLYSSACTQQWALLRINSTRNCVSSEFLGVMSASVHVVGKGQHRLIPTLEIPKR